MISVIREETFKGDREQKLETRSLTSDLIYHSGDSEILCVSVCQEKEESAANHD